MDGRVLVANRVCQLESNSLDTNLDEVLDNHVDSLDCPKFSDEIKLLTKLYLGINMIKEATTPGMKVYNLRLREAKSIISDLSDDRYPGRMKMILLTSLNLVMPYVLDKLKDSNKAKSLLNSFRYSWMTMENAKDVLKAINVFNFLMFLRDGRYLNLQNRVMGLTPCVEDRYYGFNIAINRIQMQIIHRETTWKYLAEFIMTISPYINLRWLKNKSSQLSNLIMTDNATMEKCNLAEKFKHSSSDNCAICSKQPFNPHSIGCRHIFCYYCLESNYLSDTSQGYRCKECNQVTRDKNDVVSIKIYNV